METTDENNQSSRHFNVISSEQQSQNSSYVLLRHDKHCYKPDPQVMNRHSYHGTTSSSFFPIGRGRYAAVQTTKKLMRQFTYPRQSMESHSLEHINIIGESDLLHSQSVRPEESCGRKQWSNLALSVLPEFEMMNSNDSLAGDLQGLTVDAIQRGAEIQDNARTPSSGTTLKRDEVGYVPQSHVIPQGTIPIQGQVLVDPTTGQHYIVPQATFFPPAMQTMYFHPSPAPVYYPYGQVPTQGYVVQSSSSQPQYSVPIATYQQRPYAFHPGYAQSATSSEDINRRDDDKRLEDPPPSSPCLSSMAKQSNFFPTVPTPICTTSHVQHQRHQPNPHRCSPSSQPEDPESGRDGFRRDLTRPNSESQRLSEFHRQGSGEYDRNNGEFHRSGSGSNSRSGGNILSAESEGGNRNGTNGTAQVTERTPLFGGPPQWWGRTRDDHVESSTDVESPRSHPPFSPTNTTLSESDLSRGRQMSSKAVRMDIDFNQISEDKTPKIKPPTSRSVRMDIDLSKLPDNTKVAERRAPSRVTSTAFTVNFDSPSEELSLQDAARKSAQARRILNRRSAAVSTSSKKQHEGEGRMELPSSNSSNKRYLLDKLLAGEGRNVDEACAQVTDLDDKKECDVTSEAGTYVVDLSSRVGNSSASKLMSHKIVEDSDASTDTSSDNETESDGSPIPCRKATTSPPKPSAVHGAHIQPGRTSNRGDLGHEFTKLRKLAGIRPNTSADIRAPNSVARTPGSSAISRPAPAISAQPHRGSATRASLGAQPSNRSTLSVSQGGSGSSSGPLRRGDGGRYSMRGSTPAVTPNTQQCSKRPPFRAGAAPSKAIGINTVQQKEQERNAWLRRKDYNPMKAAAEARKAKELKAREEQFMSNRSISFHVGPVMPTISTRKDGFLEMTRNRSQESLAADEAEQASQRVLAEYSRGVVKNISRLSQQSSRATGKQLSSLSRTVDILSQKCKKSIELIRSQNKGCLSVSVEDLLATASEPPRKGETLNEQLDRLSDAFDAVQRYLEQYSLDGRESPISGFIDDPLEVQSSASSFPKKKFHY